MKTILSLRKINTAKLHEVDHILSFHTHYNQFSFIIQNKVNNVVIDGMLPHIERTLRAIIIKHNNPVNYEYDLF